MKDSKTKKVIGVWNTEEAILGRTDSSSTTFVVKYFVKLVPVGQNNVPPAGVTISWNTIGNDGLPSLPIQPRTITFTGAGEYLTPDTQVGGILSIRNTQVSGLNTKFTLLADDGTSPYDPVSTNSTLIRCDHDDVFGPNRKPGCVNVFWTPTINFPPSEFPYISKNIANGKAKFNGAGNVGNPLHRVSADDAKANRKLACSDERKKALIGDPPTNDPNIPDPQCDEYPFASSIEGGRDSVLMWVPGVEENSVQGGSISGLYSSNRIMPGDWFYVN